MLAPGSAQLRAAGFGSRSAFLSSSTFGGLSWLAHSTMQSGIRIGTQRGYNQLVRSDRLTLSRAFTRAGWRAVAVMPANKRGWPEGSTFYHYDKVYDRRNVGYRGPGFGLPPMPDQYALAALQRLELARRHRPPVFAEVDLISSHAPWTRIPRLVRWDAVGDGSIFDRIPLRESTEAKLFGDDDRARKAYGLSIAYTMSTITSFVRRYGDDKTVVVLLGDHQPATTVSGEGASRDVPISIIARDPKVMKRVAGWDWPRGLRPAARGRGGGREPRRPDLDHRARPEGHEAGRGLGLAARPAPGRARAGVADERLPRPLPRRVRLAWLVVSAAAAIVAPRATEPMLVRAPAAVPRQRLAGLDGVRGLAALFVVVNHVYLRAFPGYPVVRAPFWAGWFIYGRFAVVVFIVLSGFSLALSPARHGWRLDGVSRFACRRARRILPAYWAALGFSLAVAWLVVAPPGQGPPGARSVVVNGLLVQNLVAAPSPNRAFWSMAVEAQLYLAFPLLLLIVRRWGAIAMVAAVTLVVATVGIAGPHTFVIQSPPDLAALFAIGILGAGIVGASSARRSWPWAWLALAAAAPVLATIWWRGSVWTLDHLLWVDLALGPAIGCLLAGLAAGHPAPLLRFLDSRPIRSLGLSSYSLYLIHGPIVIVVDEEFVAGRFRHGVLAFVLTVALVVPLTIA